MLKAYSLRLIKIVLLGVVMDKRERILKVIYEGIDDYNLDLPETEHIHKALDTVLFDTIDGILDSVGFLTLSTAIEKRIAAEFCQAFALFTPDIFSREDKPLRTVGSLVVYLEGKL